jgi:hypothetical protein
MPRQFRQVDPARLRLPGGRLQGADPIKFNRQLNLYKDSMINMPLILVTEGKDGELQISDGVTRATRIAKLLPGTTVLVEIIDNFPNRDFTRFPVVGERLP